MAWPAGDRCVAWRAKTGQPCTRRRHTPAALCHGEEALYAPDCFTCCPVCPRVAIFFIQYCLIFRPYREPLFCGPPALPPDARVGQEKLPILLSGRAQWLRCLPCEAIRPVCGACPYRALPGHRARAAATWHAPGRRVWSRSAAWLRSLSPLQYTPKWSSFGDWVSCG